MLQGYAVAQTTFMPIFLRCRIAKLQDVRMSAHTVALPGPKTYATALATNITGAIRPKQADQGLLGSLTDAGLPDGDTVVRVRPLRQVPLDVPTGFVVEGRRRAYAADA